MTGRALRAVVGGLVVAGLVGWWVGTQAAQRHAVAAAWRTRTDTLRVEIARLDTVYRADTVRLWRLVRQVDTLVRVDSIPVLAADSARADTALRGLHQTLTSCVSVVQTCEARLAAERRLRVLAESAAVAGGRPRPRGRAFAAGALAGAVTVLLLRR